MIIRLDELQSRMTFWVYWIAIAVTSSIIAFVLLLVYWILEPDPLTVKVYGSTTSICKDREFTFERYVQSSKPLDVYIQQRWYSLDTGVVNGIEKEIVITKSDYYPLGKDFQKVMEFTKCVPDKVNLGKYEYRPWATYQINPIKTVHKLMPVQNVDVVCDFDLSKHKSCNTKEGK